ncbi:aminotransferase class V-fold PLP-dependent enzyme [Actinomycetospora sp. TBRC 11914]|uniref:aminotransferase class V-fold PLP-dependent enzyme n=1 Tax=Actinomycetospora sp. TBRC 11914 TaxID=2729387 RepID=UPI00145F5AB9|nr:aminotransferase class V-fold PLP-dependent enzyme [Actinomycetospora sp. TBRC 11914]NMO91445.1 aminotransferase class V-fold PLP-dependent enzyme [Actinomycetospora sp. TBRC 11914]
MSLATAPPAALPRVFDAGGPVALPDGRLVPVAALNNAATTPPLAVVVDAVVGMLGEYGALHRGSGPRARATVEAVEGAVAAIERFLGQPADNALLFTTNTSAAINHLARLLALGPDDVVVTSEIEHTSNNLPWRHQSAARVAEVRADDAGALDVAHLAEVLDAHRGRVRLVAVTGASNLTGHRPDLATLADLAHDAGALLFADAAQLAPHRQIDMAASGVDALAFSAHKVYAPFGLGVLSLPRAVLDRTPVDPGGGSIDMLAADGAVLWAPPAERHQTGTWNATGIVALGAAADALLDAGWGLVEAHERALTAVLVDRLSAVEGVTPAVDPDRYRTEDRIGAVPFRVAGLHHALVASALEAEHGVEVRAGTICNHRLVRRWVGADDAEQARVEAAIAGGDRLASYGVVRASLGLQNTVDDVERLVAGLAALASEGPRLRYRPSPAQECWVPSA